MNTFRQQNHMQDKEYESQGVNTALVKTRHLREGEVDLVSN